MPSITSGTAGIAAIGSAKLKCRRGRQAPLIQGQRILLLSYYKPTGTSISSSGAYCCAPKMSGSPGLPLGRSR